MENIIKWLKKHRKLSILIFFLLFFIIPVLPFIQSPIGILLKEDAIIFLDYYGTILAGLAGGALTLFGVWWTIKDHAKERNEELALMYKPTAVLDLVAILDSSIIDSISVNKVEKNKYIIPIYITNVGYGNMTDVYIDNFKYILGSKYTAIQIPVFDRNNLSEDEKINNSISFIPKEHCAKIILNLNSETILRDTKCKREDGLDKPTYSCPHLIIGTLVYHDQLKNRYNLDFLFHIQNLDYEPRFDYYFPYIQENRLYQKYLTERKDGSSIWNHHKPN